MAQVSDLPCDGDGVCMVCKSKAVDGEILTCKTCVTPWHVTCLSARPQTLADAAQWDCPDCSDLTGALAKPAVGGGGGLVEKIRAIESDASLTDREKAKRRQELLCGGAGADDGKGKKDVNNGGGAGGVLGIFGDKFNCSICMQLLDRPVSTPCGHNFCLKCFQKWVGQQRKKTCAICRKTIPIWMAREPRINSAIVMAIRMAKSSQPNFSGGPPKTYHFIHNQDRPDKAFTTERAQKSGNANACSGKIFVTIPSDFFGPITAEHDPTRNQGVLVGETWEDRMSCRQWGAHFPHVAGICGQSDYGAQSVALSGGYLDDEDHGEWFLYTGSGGRDLSGNKRTNKNQSFDQKFTNSNEALRVSCLQGYPVRVVRSSKEKRSCYAPSEKGVRYDGVYRVEKCWRKKGGEGFLLCRYLFVRCDNDPAPWTSDNQGDRPRSSLPDIPELKQAINITERKQPPAWDYDEQQGRWIWTRPQPPSRKNQGDYDVDGQSKRKGRRQKQGTKSVKDKLLKEFSCLICRNVMVLPLTTPCAHNFCKACLESTFSGQSIVKERTCGGRRTLRTQKNVMKCPSCKSDISDFLQNPQVNREVMNVIETLQSQVEEEERLKADRSVADVDEEDVDVDAGDDAGDEDMEEEEEEESYGMDSDSIDENDNAVAEDKENCDVNAEIPKAEKKGRGRPKKVSDDTKAEPVSEGKRGLSGGAKGGVSKRKKTCSDTETAKAEKPKRSYKRKKAEAH